MMDDNETNPGPNAPAPSGTGEPPAALSTNVDSVEASNGGLTQNSEAYSAGNTGSSPAEDLQDGERLVPPPDLEAAGDKKMPEDCQPATLSISMRAEAARLNGSKSRGPTTEEGKSRSRLNALKHGLRAETLLLESGNEEENASFEALRARLEEQFPPRTIEEQLLLESMSHALWQKRRCLQFETKELRHEFVFHGPVTERLLRYGNSADKRLFRALNELKRLQTESAALQTPEHDTDPDGKGD